MTRYARKLSVVGFALTAWYVYLLGSALWQSWDGHGFGDFLGLPLAFVLGAIALPLGAAVLLRRLAAPGPASFAVRWLARLWLAFGLCGAVGYSWSLWTIASGGHFYLYLESVLNVVSLAFILAGAVFALATLPPLWSLSRRPGKGRQARGLA